MAVTTEALFAAARVEHELRGDGTRILRSPHPLGDYSKTVTDDLTRWSESAPTRVFLASREKNGWCRITYGEAGRAVRVLATALLGHNLGTERPLAILSGNSINHALLMLAALHVGVPVVPVSPAYALMSKDFGKLRHVLDRTDPGLIYVDAFAPFAAAIKATGTEDRLLTGDGAAGKSYGDFINAEPDDDAVDEAHAALTADSVAKILFTSGSTGLPKGVINSHRMLCSNQKSLARCWPFVEARPPVLVDWLPWNHTFGGNHNFNMVLRNGGTLYIDDGKPTPALIAKSAANLKEIAPTLYFNVPAGFEALLPYLEEDEELAHNFFSDLDLIFYAAAALPQKTWTRLAAASQRAVGRSIPMSSGWGTTETAPLSTSVYFSIAQAGVIGLPVPGVEIKLAPVDGRFELRVRGPNVMTSYLDDPRASAAAFDEEGFYKTGDAAVLFDAACPEAGIIFDGRIGENFKLMSGTWVNVGTLRPAFVGAVSPYLQDVVIAGHDRDEIGVLAFPHLTACRSLMGCEDAAPEEVVRDSRVVEAILEKVRLYNQANSGSSTRIARMLLLAEPPDLDANETTDKGYLNQRAILSRRSAEVEHLYAGGDGVLVI